MKARSKPTGQRLDCNYVDVLLEYLCKYCVNKKKLLQSAKQLTGWLVLPLRSRFNLEASEMLVRHLPLSSLTIVENYYLERLRITCQKPNFAVGAASQNKSKALSVSASRWANAVRFSVVLWYG